MPVYQKFEDRIRALAHVDTKAIRARVWSDSGIDTTPMLRPDYESKLAELEQVTQHVINQARGDRRTEIGKIEHEFYEALVEQCGLECFNDAQHAAIYNRAWDNSHGDGYSAVEQTFDSLVDFVADVISKRTK